MRQLIAPIVWTLLMSFAACSPAPSKYPYASEPDPRRQEYVITVGDGLSVRVWGNAELNSDITVRPDGTITIPLVGDIGAAGQTPSHVRREISRRLVAFIKGGSATVTVAVTKASYRVTVSGEVERPGVYDAQRYLTVSEAVALAGGPSRFASPNGTVVVRVGANGQSRRIPIQFGEVQAGRRPEQDLVLLSGDRVYVP